MTLVKYILEDNSEVSIEADVGQNLMQLAIDNGVEGIEGACGGSCMCATCHVKVESINGVQIEDRSEMELEVLEMEIDEVAPNSRLGCQIVISEGIESITVRIDSISSI
ncbi:MAG: 2Fe-2S iron-sulfur cluster-binding protein [Pseudomonadota bacterium]|jgi:2Fe-2S ferredoxin|nr:2Fe-2S iron-sulfur cluster-binding protein [Pseudomonadota bacterium]|tara:strand:+ start:1206 stop:1532 length:327 start_codon:yes stop_codon:yes gene_type:complete